MTKALLYDGQHEQALPLILAALGKDPTHLLLLNRGSDAHRLGRDWQASLERAHTLICHHLDVWHGYPDRAPDRGSSKCHLHSSPVNLAAVAAGIPRDRAARSQAVPPSEVQVIHNRWNSRLRDSDLATIQPDDHESARRWQQDHAPTLLRPFASALHYALEADVCRIAYACHQDCLWIDSDLLTQRATQAWLCERMQMADTVLFATRKHG